MKSFETHSMVTNRDIVVPIRSHTPYGLEENRLFLVIRRMGIYFLKVLLHRIIRASSLRIS